MFFSGPRATLVSHVASMNAPAAFRAEDAVELLDGEPGERMSL